MFNSVVDNLEKEKQRIREKIWKKFIELNISAFPPPQGRIPNFVGADQAANLLRKTDIYRNSKVIFCSPDSPQRPVREMALKDGKNLIMASPRLKHGFIIIYPEKVKGIERFASTIKGAFKLGRKIRGPISADLAVIGSVAVDKSGNRLGKGGGYGDREIRAILENNPQTVIATTVHPIQVMKKVPATSKDQKIDLIITINEVIWTEWGKKRHLIK